MALLVYQSRKRQADALCMTLLDAKNKSIWPEVLNQKCIVCARSVDHGGCCRNCFSCDFPGVSTSCPASATCGAQTLIFQFKTVTGYGGRTHTPPGGPVDCIWGTHPVYSGDFTHTSGGVSFDLDGTPEWFFCGLSYYFSHPFRADITMEFASPSADGSADPDGGAGTAVHSFVQAFYRCDNFSCAGGSFYYQHPDGPVGEGLCADGGSWPATIDLVAIPCP